MHSIYFVKTVVLDPVMGVLQGVNIWKMLCIAQLCVWSCSQQQQLGVCSHQWPGWQEVQQCHFPTSPLGCVQCCAHCQEANLVWIQRIECMGTHFSPAHADFFNLSECLHDVAKIISLKYQRTNNSWRWLVSSNSSVCRKCPDYSHQLWMSGQTYKQTETLPVQ